MWQQSVIAVGRRPTRLIALATREIPVRKRSSGIPLQDPVSEGIPPKCETREAVTPQRLNLGAGAGLDPRPSCCVPDIAIYITGSSDAVPATERMYSTMSRVSVPGPNNLPTPCFSSWAASVPGMMPPPKR